MDLTNQVIFVRRGKGGTQRVVPLDKQTADTLAGYLEEIRPILEKDQRVTAALFLNKRGDPITAEVIRAFLREYRLKAGIGVPVSPHVFRRSCATHFLRNGAHIRFVQQLLGHSSLRVTHQYTQVLPIELKRTHEKTHPGIEDAAD